MSEAKKDDSELNDLLCVGDETTVSFALGSAVAKVIGKHEVADGDVIHHVEDINTGRRDFIGLAWVNT